ncbi:hypothetical protein RFI_10486, partial [Reticulomyxa filosa]
SSRARTREKELQPLQTAKSAGEEEKEADDASDSKSECMACMTEQQAEKLKPNDKIDHRDDVGRFLLAVITEKQDSFLKIHYEGWEIKWDVWSNFTTDLHRFAVAGSISKS